MANLAHLFVSSDSSKETLHRRVIPTDEQFEAQQERWNGLAQDLRTRLSDETGLATSTWLQGSYKFGTQIRPVHKFGEFDIDVGFYFRWSGPRSRGEYGPKELKDKIQAALEIYAAGDNDATKVSEPPKKRCSRIHFRDNFHIDVPCYHLRTDVERRSLATEDDNWEDSDPKAIYEWFKRQHEDPIRTRVRRHIRYLKAWAALKFPEGGGPTSILLTVLTSEAYLQLRDGDLGRDDYCLYQIVVAIRERLLANAEVPNPVDGREDLASRLSKENLAAFVDALAKIEDHALVALEADDEVTAADAWGEVFEHLFPMPDVEASLTESALEVAKSYGAPAVVIPDVDVAAYALKDVSQKWTGKNHIGPIPRGCNITFSVSNAQLFPPGTTFEWTIRNVGKEAEETNDLGHRSGSGSSIDEESAYNGTHFTDCVAKLNGRTLSIRRVPVQIRGAIRPPRQLPPRRTFRLPLHGRR